LPDFDLARFDDLDDYARALQYAQQEWLKAGGAVDDVPALVEEATSLRDLLHSDVLALVRRGLLSGEPFRNVKKQNGHRPLATDLGVLASTLLGKFALIQGKTAITKEELNKAVELSDKLAEAIGLKARAPADTDEAAVIRRKAYTLFLKVYEDVRVAVMYVRRHEGDGDSFAPSLYAVRAAHARKREPDAPTSDEAAGSSELAADGAHPVASPAPAASATPAPEAHIPGGLPGAGPVLAPLKR
jgi:hypothetical protein